MANPWDPFSFPARADDNEMDTYAGVGVVTSGWEAIEFEFARLYGILVGDEPDGFRIREYGGPRIASDRITGLAKAADAYFVSHCDQDREARFSALINAASGFAARRNEVAHGIVMNVQSIMFFRQQIPFLDGTRAQYVLVPSFHILRNHDETGLPSYAFNGAQMAELAARMLAVEQEAKAFRLHLLQ